MENYVLAAGLCTLYRWTHLNLSTNLWIWFYYYPQRTDETTEAPRHAAPKWWLWDLNPGLSDSQTPICLSLSFLGLVVLWGTFQWALISWDYQTHHTVFFSASQSVMQQLLNTLNPYCRPGVMATRQNKTRSPLNTHVWCVHMVRPGENR